MKDFLYKLIKLPLDKAKEALWSLLFSKRLTDLISKLPLNNWKTELSLLLVGVQVYINSGHCGEYCIVIQKVLNEVLQHVGLTPEGLMQVSVATLVTSLWHSASKWIWEPEKPVVLEVNR